MKTKTRTGSMEVCSSPYRATFTTFIRHKEKTLTEHIREAYKYNLESEETDFLDHAAEQFGRRLSSQE